MLRSPPLAEHPRLLAVTAPDRTFDHHLEMLRRRRYSVERVRDLEAARTSLARGPADLLVLRLSETIDEDSLATLLRLIPEGALVVRIGDHGAALLERLGCRHEALPDPHRFTQLLRLLERLGFQSEGSQEESEQSEALAEKIIAAARKLTETESAGEQQLMEVGVRLITDLLEGLGGQVYRQSSNPKQPLILAEHYREGAVETGTPDAERLLSLALRSATTGRIESGLTRRVGYVALAAPLLLRTRVHGAVVVILTEKGAQPRRVARALKQLSDQLAANLQNAMRWKELQDNAVIDSLTGLMNRRHFDRQIEIELERARRTQRGLTLAILDVDHFKQVNDTRGYAEGDRLLRAIAALFKRNLREIDVLIRWGGDEFALLLPETGHDRDPTTGLPRAQVTLERLRRRVEEARFSEDFGDDVPQISISVGAACFPEDGRSTRDLFLAANHALHRAKRGGKNRVELSLGPETDLPLPRPSDVREAADEAS